MNTFGRLFRLNIFGESHGASVGIAIDGCPAGIQLSADDFSADMLRRQGGNQKGATPRKEDDIPVFLSGIFNNTTTGAPLTILFENKNIRSADYDRQRAIPRPGHADFVGSKKFGGYEDYRGSGHFSGRMTVCLVAAGVVAKKILATTSNAISVKAAVTEAGGETDIERGLELAIAANDSIGAIVECVAEGLPVGLGEPFFDSVESLIAHAALSIPAIKGIEFGAGFRAAKMKGTEHNDPITDAEGKTSSNHAGGVIGGLTNGNSLVFRVAVKPASSTPKEQQSYNKETGNVEPFSITGRHDLCIALRVPVVLEAVSACVITDLMMMEQRVGRVVNKE